MAPLKLLLLLTAFVVGTSARSIRTADVEVRTPVRQLQQSAFCPDGCAPGQCVQDATSGGLRCLRCVNSLVVNTITGQCACPAGRFSADGAPDCRDCRKGSWCPGGMYTPSAQPPQIPPSIACPPNMTTVGMRSISIRACVNLPGFYYTLDNSEPGAVHCPIDSYGPGYKKQRSCVPCPTGFTTNSRVQQIWPTSCVVPAGYYLKLPGQVAPCPQGEWKAEVGASANCTKCADGVTTPREASASESECKLLLPGFFALKMSPDGTITQAQLCPQGYFCPGVSPNSTFDPSSPGSLAPSEPSIKRCPNGMWTLDVGSYDVQQCLTPPGFFTANGTTQPCPEGSFRANWKANAGSCETCGEGVKSDKTDRVSVYNPVDYSVTYLPVSSTSEDCYIQPGQGLYYSAVSKAYRARNCDSSSYGVSNVTYGLNPSPCRDCPSGQIASTNASQYPTSASYFVRNADGSGGFVSSRACVNQPGFGFNGRESERCPAGSFNAGDTYSSCVDCPYGFTTAGPGVGVAAGDCGIAAGFGDVNGTVRPCPIGTYNPVSWSPGNNATCTACPIFTTTQQEGATAVDFCFLCVGGFGGEKCLTQCGGVGANATYGPPGRPVGAPCLPCSISKTGFSFEWQMQNDLFPSRSISRAGADRSCDCLSEYQQMVDGAWYIRTTASQGRLSTGFAAADSFAGCVELCTQAGPDCMWATYDYVTKQCYTRIAASPTAGAPIVGIKAMPSGDMASTSRNTTPSSHANCTRSVTQAVTSGRYSFYRDAAAADILGTEAAPGRDSFTSSQDCITVCDNDDKCAGVILQDVQDKAKTCALIKGDPTLGVFLRTATRTDVTRLAFPSTP